MFCAMSFSSVVLRLKPKPHSKPTREYQRSERKSIDHNIFIVCSEFTTYITVIYMYNIIYACTYTCTHVILNILLIAIEIYLQYNNTYMFMSMYICVHVYMDACNYKYAANGNNIIM